MSLFSWRFFDLLQAESNHWPVNLKETFICSTIWHWHCWSVLNAFHWFSLRNEPLQCNLPLGTMLIPNEAHLPEMIKHCRWIYKWSHESSAFVAMGQKPQTLLNKKESWTTWPVVRGGGSLSYVFIRSFLLPSIICHSSRLCTLLRAKVSNLPSTSPKKIHQKIISIILNVILSTQTMGQNKGFRSFGHPPAPKMHWHIACPLGAFTQFCPGPWAGSQGSSADGRLWLHQKLWC